MKKLPLILTLSSILLTMSCKKETVETTEVKGDSTTVTTTESTSLDVDWKAQLAKAESDLNNAKEKLAEATKNGDEKAKVAAQKTVEEATTAWEKAKTEIKDTAEKTEEKLGDIKDTVKTKYNEVLEKAKAK